MYLSIKISSGNKTRVVNFCPSPLTFPITFGKGEENHVIVDTISSFRLEYDSEELILVPSAPIYRVDDVTENKINSGTRVIVKHKNIFRNNQVIFQFKIDLQRGNILLKNTKAREILERKYGKLWLVGFGGIASVYASEKRDIAIKVLGIGYNDPKMIERFKSAGEKIKKLDHLGLIKVGESFSASEHNLFYTEMEYCNGVTLQEMILRKGKIRLGQAFSLIRQLVEVVKYISSQRIVHRDINPKNILVDSTLCLKLLGITLIKSEDSDLTQKGTKMFTPNFSAPEQINDASVADQQADMFSLGAVTYYLISGTPPFEAVNHSQYIQLIYKNTIPISLKNKIPSISQDLSDLIDQALAIEKDKRPSISEFAKAFEWILNRVRSKYESISASKIRSSDETVLGDFLDSEEVHKIGRFNIVRELGSGGLGRVYEAFDTKLSRKVAIKLLRRGVFADDHEVERFKEEASLVARLKHPGINRIYEVHQEGNHPYIVMELIEGKSLDDWALNATPREIAEKIKQIADILAYAHSEHIIHRDIKPSNIIVNADNDPILLDFGMARDLKREKRLTRSGVFVGTPAYASPEQFRYEAPAPAMDVYSLGIVFYELLTKRLPFDEDHAKLVSKIITGKLPTPVKPCDINSDIAIDIETICLHAIAVDKNKRYQTIKEMSEDINRFLNGEVIKLANAHIVKRAWYMTKRNWKYMIPTTSALLFLLISVYFVLVIDKQSIEDDIYINLEKGRELISIFPGKTPRKTYREARNYLEFARSIASEEHAEIREALISLYFSYGNWALKSDQLELVEDSLAYLKSLEVPRTQWESLERNLQKAIWFQKQRNIFNNWEEQLAIRLKAARKLEKDRSNKTLEVLKRALNDPLYEIRKIAQEILKKVWQIEVTSTMKEKAFLDTNYKKRLKSKDIYSLKNILPQVALSKDFPTLPLLMFLSYDKNNRPQRELEERLQTFLLQREEQVRIDLLALLKEDDEQLQLFTLDLIQLCQKKEIAVYFVSPVSEMLASSSKKIRIRASMTLSKIGKYKVETLIRLLIKGFQEKYIIRILIDIGESSLEAVVKLLKNPKARLRKQAYRIIKGIDYKAVPYLIKELSNSDLGLRYRIMNILSSLSVKSLPALVKGLETDDEIVLEKILNIIENFGENAKLAKKHLLLYIDSPKTSIRYATFKTLISIDTSEKIIPILIKKLKDRDDKIVNHALVHLRKFGKGASSARNLLEAMLARKHGELQKSIILTLGSIGDKKSIQNLKKLFDKADWKLSYIIAHSIMNIRLTQNHPALRFSRNIWKSEANKRYQKLIRLKKWEKESYYCFSAGLKDPDPRICGIAIQTLGDKNKKSKLFNNLIKCLSHSSSEVKENALITLGTLGNLPEDKLPLITNIIINDNDKKVRLAAINNVLRMSRANSDIIVALIKALETSDEELTLAIEIQLEKIKTFPKRLVVKLIPLLQFSSLEVKYHTIDFLKRMGDLAKDSVPYLLYLFEEADNTMRTKLFSALKLIGLPDKRSLNELRKCLSIRGEVRIETLKIVAKLGEIARPLWKDIITLFRRSDRETKRFIKEALEKVRAPILKDKYALRKGLNSSNRSIVIYSIQAVGHLGKHGVREVDLLVDLLSESNRTIINQVIKTLAEMGDFVLKPLLGHIETNENQIIRVRISKAIRKMTPSKLPILIEELLKTSTKQSKYRARIAYTIGLFGKNAIKSLIKIFQGKDGEKRYKISLALVYIGIPSIKPLNENIFSPVADIRRITAFTLGLIGKFLGKKYGFGKIENFMGQSVEKIIRLLRDKKTVVRLESAKALGKIALYLDDPTRVLKNLVLARENEKRQSRSYREAKFVVKALQQAIRGIERNRRYSNTIKQRIHEILGK